MITNDSLKELKEEIKKVKVDVKGRVKICTPKFINNEHISAFLCSIINMNSYLFSYGRKASGTIK